MNRTNIALTMARDYLLWLVNIRGIKEGSVEVVRKAIDDAMTEPPDKSTLAMWRAGADFFSSQHSVAERCQKARDCYEAMIRAQPKDTRSLKPWHYPSADESKRE